MLNRQKIYGRPDNKGIEVYYYPDQKAIYIAPTNCRWDWFTNIAGWLFPLKVNGRLVNRTWYREVRRAEASIFYYEFTSVFCYSRGGGEMQYLCDKILISQYSISGFPGFLRGDLSGTLYYKSGDIVPLFSRRRYSFARKFANDGNFIQAHKWSREDIETIIEAVCK